MCHFPMVESNQSAHEFGHPIVNGILELRDQISPGQVGNSFPGQGVLSCRLGVVEVEELLDAGHL